MPSYRLLRSNKESGPYSLQDLLTLGLKPYDLVWVEGRSAAWRYPSEVSELKEFAPAVEEQPFDRFFKKPSEKSNQSHETKIPPQPELVEQPVKREYAKVEEAATVKAVTEEAFQVKKINTFTSYPSYTPPEKKKVFVAMPETNGYEPAPSPAVLPSSSLPAVEHEKYQQYLPKSTQQKAPQKEERTYSTVNIQESEESRLETKYTQSLDDIKDMYINTLVQRKTKNKRKEIARKYLRPALLPLLLVLAGIAIGYYFTSRKNSPGPIQQVSKVVVPQLTPGPKSEDPLDEDHSQPDNKNTTAVTDGGENKPQTPAEENPNNEKKPTHDDANAGQKKTQPSNENKSSDGNVAVTTKITTPVTREQKSVIPTPDETTSYQKKDVEVDPTTGERKSVTRSKDDVVTTDNGKDKVDRSMTKSGSEHVFLENEPKNLLQLVSVKSNNYVRGTFGGIRDLELTVFNNSNYLLDEVNVEVQIIKPSEEPLRTDVITFRNISANGTVTVKVPDSQRGIRVDYRITNIESKQWQKGTAGL